jgi:hypothetical protein
MAAFGDDREDRALWRRWRDTTDSTAAAEPDALALAAYAEGRLGEVAAEAVEFWLAEHPESVSDIVAARVINQRPPRLVFNNIIAHASGLVEGSAMPSNVVPLRRWSSSSWRNALAWSSVAASLVLVSFGGFSMGSSAYANLASATAADGSSPDSPDATGSIDIYFSDDSST